MTVKDACAKKQPRFLVLSFGINGIIGFSQNKDRYVSNYQKLIKTVQEVSPSTKIILQTVYPVRASGGFSVDTDTLNRYIDTLNTWLPEIAARYANVKIADTASVLKDDAGWLKSFFDAGDGLHLNTAAYRAILQYLGTHTWPESEN